ncbi:hypothetical protein PSN_4230 [Pseudomonas sp. NGC7]
MRPIAGKPTPTGAGVGCELCSQMTGPVLPVKPAQNLWELACRRWAAQQP